jgi:hypothetical protein
MSRVQDSTEPATRAPGGAAFDVKPGVVVIPVSDVDTGTAFYAGQRRRDDDGCRRQPNAMRIGFDVTISEGAAWTVPTARRNSTVCLATCRSAAGCG